MKKPCSATDPLWYKDAVIYELHVRAFMDSNDDGIGDFQGLISKLDYLQDLGVTCLWVLPFFPSPLRDDGYDIANYTDVNPSYGTIDDFRQFLDAAHARNMQVMIELVINHTSDQHPWFQRARRAPKGSPEREFYVWSDTDQLYRDARIIFTDTEKSNWTWDDVAQQYYWHRFFSHQPDLNFDNPAVMEEVLKAMRFWLDMGVDAMRMDAIPYLVERDGTNCENLLPTHEKIKEIRAAIDEGYANRLILAEANQWPADVRPYFGDGDECHMAFHFPLMPRIYMAIRQEDRLPITDIMAQTPEIPHNCQWGIFLRNHDELTLEMVTDDERDYMYLAYSADPRMRINVGIRRRLAPLVDNNRRRIELLNSLLFSFPGTPIMYYGDEIGMGDNIYLGDRNGVRTPMQWNSDRNAGFSRAVPAKLYFPVIMDPIWGYQAINVEAQQADPSSLLHWTRNMIALRKLFQVFGRGTLEFLHPENRKVLAYIRDYQSTDGMQSETVLCVANLSRFAQPVALDLARFVGRQPVEMLGYVSFPEIGTQPYPLTLAPYSFLWLEIQQAVREPEPAVVETKTAAMDQKLVTAAAFTAEGIMKPEAQSFLQQVLPAYIAQQRWFGGKSRTIASVRVTSSTPVPSSQAALTTVEVCYKNEPSAATEVYQIPVAVASGAQAEELRVYSPRAVIASFDNSQKGPVVYDAIADEGFRKGLLRMIVEGDASSAAGEERTLLSTRSRALDAEALVAATSRVGSAEQSNSSMIYGNLAILKLFRKISAGENPEVEMTRFLTETAHFEHIPAYLGDLHRASDSATVAFLQAFARNQGDGWAWTLEELGQYYESVVGCPAPSSVGSPAAFDRADDLPPEAREHAGLYLEAAHLLGQRTAELHLALATPTSDVAFEAEPFTGEELATERERIEQQVTTALALLERTLAASEHEFTPETVEQAQEVLGRRGGVKERLAELSGDPMQFGQRIRIHGDLHLGQLLRARTDFLFVDFEGEPARSLEERRKKQSPLRDVAGMLRSFSYGAHATLGRHSARRPEHSSTLEPWATLWERSVSNEFLRGYRETIDGSRLMPAPEKAQLFLRALLLEKACYELAYELNNRPTWLHIPLAGVRELLG
ncbi:MAG TPA: maltose alpha-D-glucosyltransferase [Acidobacteriaceae bacterium]|nr:maltose alpha-D-glucosyltransferase [Acidobacteriaceae bacterium]